jgi:DNA-binding MarR family transcriptional regulator
MVNANPRARAEDHDEIDVLMDTSRIFTAALVRSLTSVGNTVTVAQLRVLVLLSSPRVSNLTKVASRLGVNVSNASRTCEQLVALGLVERIENAEDRRNVDLSLTAAGTRLLRDVMRRREQLLSQVLVQMSDTSRRRLTQALRDFNRAADSVNVSLDGLATHAPGRGPDAEVLPWLA